MELATLWLALVGAAAAVASAVFAFVQAKAATDDRRDAETARAAAEEARDESARLAAEATDAFKRQAEAQEEANKLKREELAPADWEIGQTGDNSFRASNASKRTIFVKSIDVYPKETERLIDVRTSHDDGTYEYGDSFTITVIPFPSFAPEKITIKYRRDDDNEDDYRTLHVSV